MPIHHFPQKEITSVWYYKALRLFVHATLDLMQFRFFNTVHNRIAELKYSDMISAKVFVSKMTRSQVGFGQCFHLVKEPRVYL